ncbi:MAG TPA: DUF4202 domain-containing protein [Methylococcaceae bacterium]|jgi:hypothetical protein|nr:DUF4202 domain-containing protein [Methylococcaceae bacterium]
MISERLIKAIELIDRANSEDPNREAWEGRVYPKELLYSQRMTDWLERLAPDAPESTQLAARAQHVRRWMVAREDYPATREGYLRWRSFLYRFHAEQAEILLRQAGYDEETIAAVRKMVAKQGVKRDPGVQLIEDVACLVFLEHYFPVFADAQDEDKLIDIVRKTWRKMSEIAHARALELELPAHLQAIVAKALSS